MQKPEAARGCCIEGGACGVARHYAAPSEADDGDEEVAWAATRMDTGCDALKRDTRSHSHHPSGTA